jgi:CpeT protein
MDGGIMGKAFITASMTAIFILAIYSCKPQLNDMDLLLSYMTGSFSSQEQAQADTNFKDIRVEIVQIWKDRMDGFWLYVEQSAADNMDHPYRQRVHHVTQLSDSTFKGEVYAIDNPMRFAGSWKQENPLGGLTPDSLIERKGCAVILTKQKGDVFVGVTESLTCDSDLHGAAFATSVVLITKDQMYTWDRGFNITGNQVWGSTAGGYVFKKVK